MSGIEPSWTVLDRVFTFRDRPKMGANSPAFLSYFRRNASEAAMKRTGSSIQRRGLLLKAITSRRT